MGRLQVPWGTKFHWLRRSSWQGVHQKIQCAATLLQRMTPQQPQQATPSDPYRATVPCRYPVPSPPICSVAAPCSPGSGQVAVCVAVAKSIRRRTRNLAAPNPISRPDHQRPLHRSSPRRRHGLRPVP